MVEINSSSRFAVVGTGGVGGYLGGLMADAGLDVTFVSRRDAEVLSTKGLVLRTADRELRLPSVKAVPSPAELKDVDVVLLTTKTYDLLGAVGEISDEVIRSSMLITFQNGIDNDQSIKTHFSESTVYPGVAYIISSRTAPGEITQSAGPRTFLVGERGMPSNTDIENVALVMRSAGIDVKSSTDIEKALWTKFIWIIAFAGVTGLCRSPIGPVVNDPVGFNLFERCVDEAIAVARALSVDVGPEDKRVVMDKAIAYRTKGQSSVSSLALDLMNGRPTELQSLHGTLVKLSKELGIPTPTVETIYAGISLGQQHQQQEGPR